MNCILDEGGNEAEISHLGLPTHAERVPGKTFCRVSFEVSPLETLAMFKSSNMISINTETEPGFSARKLSHHRKKDRELLCHPWRPASTYSKSTPQQQS
jgi:hypothetical protein